jgi:ribosomal protein S19E (S16A)
MLQQLEAAGWMKKSQRGRELTVQGRRLLDSLAYEVSRSG